MNTQLRKTSICLILIISACMLFAQLAPTALSDYQDTQGHWAAQSIDKWAGYGLVEGYAASFRPDDAILRGEFSAIVNRLFQFQKVAENEFVDLSPEDWYYDHVQKLVSAGILNGVGEQRMDPQGQISRQQAISMLARVFGVKPSQAGLEGFLDASEVAEWARPLVAGMVDMGAVQGAERFLHPNAGLTRAEAVRLIDNMVGVLYPTGGQYSAEGETGLLMVNAAGVSLSNARTDRLIVTPGILDGTFTLRNSAGKHSKKQ